VPESRDQGIGLNGSVKNGIVAVFTSSRGSILGRGASTGEACGVGYAECYRHRLTLLSSEYSNVSAIAP